MISERFIITIVTSVLLVSTYLFFRKKKFLNWQLLSISTLLLTGSMLVYYHYFVFDPSHGISIMILPLITWWLVWRRETTGKPAFSVRLFVVLQLMFSVLYVIITRIQEH